MSYHLDEIIKGTYGEHDKIFEEYLEFFDAVKQNDKILQLVELSDLIGAIEGYAQTHLNTSLNDLIKFSNKTKRAFLSGKRKAS